MVAEPDILDTELTGSDTFLIMATDGLWDVVSNQDAIAMVRVSTIPTMPVLGCHIKRQQHLFRQLLSVIANCA